MESTYANVHRGEHTLSVISTEMFEKVPHQIADFVGIKDLDNSGKRVILTSNTTSSLDLGSHLFGHIDGKVVTTLMEHHSNDLPHRRRGQVEHVEVFDTGILDMGDLEKKLENHDVKLVAVSGGSNVTGYIPDIHKIARMAHDAGAKILVDAAQRLAHMKVEVKPVDHPEHIDYLAGAGHKTYAPFGSAFLIGTTEEMNDAPPYIPAGGTVKFVGDRETLYKNGPDRHTPGTPNIAGAVAMGASLDFLSEIGMDWVRKHEIELMEPVLKRFAELDAVEVLGQIPIEKKLGVISFNIIGYYHSRVSKLLDQKAGIATRNGCFCAHPYVNRLIGSNLDQQELIIEALRDIDDADSLLPGAVRASIGIYNTKEEMDILVNTVEEICNGDLN
jgi:selenocysteine lyase/cysteine desulfurase